MTDHQRQVIKRARKSRARFIETAPSRPTRFTAGQDALRKIAERTKQRASACLEAELQRLVETWDKCA